MRKELHWKIKSFSLISFLFASSTSHDISFFIELVSIACFIGRSKREEVRTKELLKIYLQTFSHKREISSRKFKFNDKVYCGDVNRRISKMVFSSFIELLFDIPSQFSIDAALSLFKNESFNIENLSLNDVEIPLKIKK